jgi:hypothetical protein
MSVRDSGRGFSDEPIQVGGGVGLANIRERLHALFGARAKLTLEANSPKGVVAYIEVPAAGSAAFSSGGLANSASGSGMLGVAGFPQALSAQPKTWKDKTLHAASRTHSAWTGFLAKSFVAIIAVLGVMFIVGLIGLAFGLLPISIGEARISGIESMAIGTVLLLIAFGALSVVALIVIAILYGLGFVFVALAIGIPLLIVVSAFPALAPFFVVGFAVYWFWWRKRKRAIIINPPRE